MTWCSEIRLFGDDETSNRERTSTFSTDSSSFAFCRSLILIFTFVAPPKILSLYKIPVMPAVGMISRNMLVRFDFQEVRFLRSSLVFLPPSSPFLIHSHVLADVSSRVLTFLNPSSLPSSLPRLFFFQQEIVLGKKVIDQRTTTTVLFEQRSWSEGENEWKVKLRNVQKDPFGRTQLDRTPEEEE